LTLRIRAATDADGPALAWLIAQVFSEYPGCQFLIDEFPELARPASHYAAKGGRLDVVEDDGGTIVGSFATFLSGAPGTIELGKVYLAKAYRGRGIALELLTRAIAEARQRGITRIELFTDTRFFDGHRFYERHGFERRPAERYIADASDTWEYHYDLSL
jgi:putative acetyltransferase